MVLAQAIKTLSEIGARIRCVEACGESGHVIDAELRMQEKARKMSEVLTHIEAEGLCVYEATLDNDNHLVCFKLQTQEAEA